MKFPRMRRKRDQDDPCPPALLEQPALDRIEAEQERRARAERVNAERVDAERRKQRFRHALRHYRETPPGDPSTLNLVERDGRDQYAHMLQRFADRVANERVPRFTSTVAHSLDDLSPELWAYLVRCPEVRETLTRLWPYERIRRNSQLRRASNASESARMIAERTTRATDGPSFATMPWLYHVQHRSTSWLHKIGIGTDERVSKWKRSGWTVVDQVLTPNAYQIEQELHRQIRLGGGRLSRRLLDEGRHGPDGYSEWFDADTLDNEVHSLIAQTFDECRVHLHSLRAQTRSGIAGREQEASSPLPQRRASTSAGQSGPSRLDVLRAKYGQSERAGMTYAKSMRSGEGVSAGRSDHHPGSRPRLFVVPSPAPFDPDHPTKETPETRTTGSREDGD